MDVYCFCHYAVCLAGPYEICPFQLCFSAVSLLPLILALLCFDIFQVCFYHFTAREREEERERKGLGEREREREG